MSRPYEYRYNRFCEDCGKLFKGRKDQMFCNAPCKRKRDMIKKPMPSKLEPIITEKDNDDTIICSHFGCAKKLTLTEKRYGSKCFNHSSTQKTDINKFIQL